MGRLTWKRGTLALALAAAVATGPALAEKPSWTGGGKAEKHGKKAQHERRDHERNSHSHVTRDRNGSIGAYFGNRQRSLVYDYFARQYHRGHCPPGLAKKNNGCMPPGQARKWQLGRPLPRDVIFYDLPAAVVAELGPPPTGHRYVRVAADILLITVGTGMVIDAIQDLGRM